MITIIAGTNRKGSATETFAKQFHKIFKAKTKEKIKYISLQKLPKDVLHNMMYNPKKQSKGLRKMQEESLLISDKFFFVAPEYNGSIPGVLKLFIDACSIHEYAATFKGKKSWTGRRCFRSCRQPSRTRSLEWCVKSCRYSCDAKGEITNKGTLKAMENQVDAFLKF